MLFTSVVKKLNFFLEFTTRFRTTSFRICNGMIGLTAVKILFLRAFVPVWNKSHNKTDIETEDLAVMDGQYDKRKKIITTVKKLIESLQT